MGSFSQMCQDVITKTGRPELVAETQLAVRNATKFLHMQEFYMRDSEEKLLQFANPDFLFQIDVTGLERFRKLRYVKKFDLSSMIAKDTEQDKIKEVDPDFLFDRYNNPKKNVFYMAGSSINVKLDTQEQGLLVSWYKYPNTTPESFQSWIAEIYDVAIINKAAAEIFRNVGMKDDGASLDKWVLEIDIPVIRMNDIEATAR